MNLSFWHSLPGCLVLSVIYLGTLRVPLSPWPNVSIGFILSDVVADLLELGLRLRDTISRLHPSQSAQPWLARKLWCFVHGQIRLVALVLLQTSSRRAKHLVQYNLRDHAMQLPGLLFETPNGALSVLQAPLLGLD